MIQRFRKSDGVSYAERRSRVISMERISMSKSPLAVAESWQSMQWSSWYSWRGAAVERPTPSRREFAKKKTIWELVGMSEGRWCVYQNFWALAERDWLGWGSKEVVGQI